MNPATPSRRRQRLKEAANGACLFQMLPIVALYLLAAAVLGKGRMFPGFSQALSLLPGWSGVALRRAFYRCVLDRCGDDLHLGFGTVLVDPAVSFGRGVYVGVYCVIGAVTLKDDVLIASHVSVTNGYRQHGLTRLDVPIRDQPGDWPTVSLGPDCWVGERAVVMADVGPQAVIGAGAVVTRAVPARAIAIGVPAKVVRFREALEPADLTSSPEPLETAAVSAGYA